ncbi:MAG: FkbM family methyltransferase [Rhodothermales bacterium]
MGRLFRGVKARARHLLALRESLVEEEILGRVYHVRRGTVRPQPDYDDAWFLACALHARIIFDIGANVGYNALLAARQGNVDQVVLVDANAVALSAAAENLIRNGVGRKARFVRAFVADSVHDVVTFWTVGKGAAGSMYASHAQTASKHASHVSVSTVTVDYLSEEYGLLPDFVKVDVEGAEREVLAGSAACARHEKTRFLVEMHSNQDLSMSENAADVLSWCKSVNYRAWYLKEHVMLEGPEMIRHRGRCHLLLQPAPWPLPSWLQRIEQSAPLEHATISA